MKELRKVSLTSNLETRWLVKRLFIDNNYVFLVNKDPFLTRVQNETDLHVSLVLAFLCDIN